MQRFEWDYISRKNENMAVPTLSSVLHSLKRILLLVLLKSLQLPPLCEEMQTVVNQLKTGIALQMPTFAMEIKPHENSEQHKNK